MSERVVVVSELEKSYGHDKVVDSLSFEVPPGCIFTLVGPNGAGKTTTTRMLIGALRPDAGETRVLGLDPTRDGHLLRERIGVLGQSFSFYDRLTPREILSYFASLYRQHVDTGQLLDDLSLAEIADRPFRYLSGGTRRRVGLGCALVNDPSVLFLDEPTTGVDPIARREIWEILEKLRRQGKSIFLTTHYMDEAQKLSDVVGVLNHGRLIASGHPEALLSQYGVSRQAVLRGLSPADCVRLGTRFPQAVRGASGEMVVPAGAHQLGILVNALDQLGIEAPELVIRESSLDDVFIALARDGTAPRVEPQKPAAEQNVNQNRSGGSEVMIPAHETQVSPVPLRQGGQKS